MPNITYEVSLGGDAFEKIDSLVKKFDELSKLSVNLNINSIESAISKIEESLSKLPKDIAVNFSSNAGDVLSQVQGIVSALEGIPKDVSITFTSNIDELSSKINNLVATLGAIQKSVSIGVSAQQPQKAISAPTFESVSKSETSIKDTRDTAPALFNTLVSAQKVISERSTKAASAIPTVESRPAEKVATQSMSGEFKQFAQDIASRTADAVKGSLFQAPKQSYQEIKTVMQSLPEDIKYKQIEANSASQSVVQNNVKNVFNELIEANKAYGSQEAKSYPAIYSAAQMLASGYPQKSGIPELESAMNTVRSTLAIEGKVSSKLSESPKIEAELGQLTMFGVKPNAALFQEQNRLAASEQMHPGQLSLMDWRDPVKEFVSRAASEFKGKKGFDPVAALRFIEREAEAIYKNAPGANTLDAMSEQITPHNLFLISTGKSPLVVGNWEKVGKAGSEWIRWTGKNKEQAELTQQVPQPELSDTSKALKAIGDSFSANFDKGEYETNLDNYRRIFSERTGGTPVDKLETFASFRQGKRFIEASWKAAGNEGLTGSQAFDIVTNRKPWDMNGPEGTARIIPQSEISIQNADKKTSDEVKEPVKLYMDTQLFARKQNELPPFVHTPTEGKMLPIAEAKSAVGRGLKEFNFLPPVPVGSTYQEAVASVVGQLGGSFTSLDVENTLGVNELGKRELYQVAASKYHLEGKKVVNYPEKDLNQYILPEIPFETKEKDFTHKISYKQLLASGAEHADVELPKVVEKIFGKDTLPVVVGHAIGTDLSKIAAYSPESTTSGLNYVSYDTYRNLQKARIPKKLEKIISEDFGLGNEVAADTMHDASSDARFTGHYFSAAAPVFSLFQEGRITEKETQDILEIMRPRIVHADPEKGASGGYTVETSPEFQAKFLEYSTRKTSDFPSFNGAKEIMPYYGMAKVGSAKTGETVGLIDIPDISKIRETSVNIRIGFNELETLPKNTEVTAEVKLQSEVPASLPEVAPAQEKRRSAARQKQLPMFDTPGPVGRGAVVGVEEIKQESPEKKFVGQIKALSEVKSVQAKEPPIEQIAAMPQKAVVEAPETAMPIKAPKTDNVFGNRTGKEYEVSLARELFTAATGIYTRQRVEKQEPVSSVILTPNQVAAQGGKKLYTPPTQNIIIPQSQQPQSLIIPQRIAVQETGIVATAQQVIKDKYEWGQNIPPKPGVTALSTISSGSGFSGFVPPYSRNTQSGRKPPSGGSIPPSGGWDWGQQPKQLPTEPIKPDIISDLADKYKDRNKFNQSDLFAMTLTSRAIQGIGEEYLSIFRPSEELYKKVSPHFQKTRVVSEMSDDQYSTFIKQMKEVAPTTMMPLTEVAELSYMFETRGYSTPETTPNVVRTLGAAGRITGEDPLQMSGAIMSLMQTWNPMSIDALKVKALDLINRFSDVMTYSYVKSPMESKWLKDIANYAAPTFATMGFSPEDTVSTFMAMSQMIPTAGVAARGTRMALYNLFDPEKIQGATEKYGIDFNEIASEVTSSGGTLGDALESLAQKISGLSIGDQLSVLRYIGGGVRGATALQALMPVTSMISGYAVDLKEKSVGYTASANRYEYLTEIGQFKAATASKEAAQYGVGEKTLPVVTAWTKLETSALEGLSSMSTPVHAGLYGAAKGAGLGADLLQTFANVGMLQLAQQMSPGSNIMKKGLMASGVAVGLAAVANVTSYLDQQDAVSSAKSLYKDLYKEGTYANPEEFFSMEYNPRPTNWFSRTLGIGSPNKSLEEMNWTERLTEGIGDVVGGFFGLSQRSYIGGHWVEPGVAKELISSETSALTQSYDIKESKQLLTLPLEERKEQLKRVKGEKDAIDMFASQSLSTLSSSEQVLDSIYYFDKGEMSKLSSQEKEDYNKTYPTYLNAPQAEEQVKYITSTLKKLGATETGSAMPMSNLFNINRAITGTAKTLYPDDEKAQAKYINETMRSVLTKNGYDNQNVQGVDFAALSTVITSLVSSLSSLSGAAESAADALSSIEGSGAGKQVALTDRQLSEWMNNTYGQQKDVFPMPGMSLQRKTDKDGQTVYDFVYDPDAAKYFEAPASSSNTAVPIENISGLRGTESPTSETVISSLSDVSGLRSSTASIQQDLPEIQISKLRAKEIDEVIGQEPQVMEAGIWGPVAKFAAKAVGVLAVSSIVKNAIPKEGLTLESAFEFLDNTPYNKAIRESWQSKIPPEVEGFGAGAAGTASGGGGAMSNYKAGVAGTTSGGGAGGAFGDEVPFPKEEVQTKEKEVESVVNLTKTATESDLSEIKYYRAEQQNYMYRSSLSNGEVVVDRTKVDDLGKPYGETLRFTEQDYINNRSTVYPEAGDVRKEVVSALSGVQSIPGTASGGVFDIKEPDTKYSSREELFSAAIDKVESRKGPAKEGYEYFVDDFGAYGYVVTQRKKTEQEPIDFSQAKPGYEWKSIEAGGVNMVFQAKVPENFDAETGKLKMPSSDNYEKLGSISGRPVLDSLGVGQVLDFTGGLKQPSFPNSNFLFDSPMLSATSGLLKKEFTMPEFEIPGKPQLNFDGIQGSISSGSDKDLDISTVESALMQLATSIANAAMNMNGLVKSNITEKDKISQPSFEKSFENYTAQSRIDYFKNIPTSEAYKESPLRQVDQATYAKSTIQQFQPIIPDITKNYAQTAIPSVQQQVQPYSLEFTSYKKPEYTQETFAPLFQTQVQQPQMQKIDFSSNLQPPAKIDIAEYTQKNITQSYTPTTNNIIPQDKQITIPVFEPSFNNVQQETKQTVLLQQYQPTSPVVQNQSPVVIQNPFNPAMNFQNQLVDFSNSLGVVGSILRASMFGGIS